MKEKIAMTFVAVIMVAMLVLTGCATTYSEDELNAYAGSKVSDANTKSQLQLDTMSNELESVKASLETAVSDKEVLQLSYNDVVAEKAALEDEKETATEIEAVENSVLFMSDDLDVESPFDKSIRFDTTSIRFDGDTYSIKEYVEMDGAEFAVDGDEFKDNLYMNVYADSITYKLKLDKDLTEIIDGTDLSKEKPLTIDFLGKELKISSLDEDEMKVVSGNEYFVKEGETINIDGRDYLIEMIGEDYIFVRSGNDYSKINFKESEIVGDIDIYVSEVLENSNGVSYAEIIAGDDVDIKFEDERDYKESDEWKFEIDNTTSSYILSVTYQETRDSAESDEDFPALAEGECLALPEDYRTICFDSTNKPEYFDFELSFDDEDVLNNGTDVDVVVIESKDDLMFEFDSGFIEVDTIYAYNGTFYYKDVNAEDEEPDFIKVDDNITFVDADFSLSVEAFNTTVSTISIVDGTYGFDMSFDASLADKLKVAYVDDNEEDNFMTTYGIKVLSPEDNTDNDVVELSIPDERLKAIYSLE